MLVTGATAVVLAALAAVSASALAQAKPCAPRVYPPESLQAREQGTAWVKITIVRDGTPIKSEIVRSSGYPRLDAATLEHVRTCKFTPGRKEGVRTLTMRYRWAPEVR